MLDLYHWEPNGSFLKVLIALHEKDVAYSGHYVDLLAGERIEAAVQPSAETRLNPEGEGPLLVHDGRQLTESLFMLEYLEDVFAQRPLKPADPRLHATILAWARFINETFMPAVSTLGCHAFLAPSLAGDAGDVLRPLVERLAPGPLKDGWRQALSNSFPEVLLQDSRRKAGEAAMKIEAALSTSAWLAGPDYSIADIDAFAIANSLPELLPDRVNADKSPRLMEWLGRIRSRPAVHAALAASRTGRPQQAFVPGPEHARWG